MLRKISLVIVLFILVFHPQVIEAKEENNLEIFDPEQNKVLREIPMDEEIQNMIVDWVNNIEDICLEMSPITDDGYAVRFPCKSSIQVENKWLNASIKEVYLIIPESKSPSLIIFGDEGNPLCFSFTGDIDKLSTILGFELR